MALPPPAPDSTALVTGASSGIGRELARELAARGHGVTLVARRVERLNELAAELTGDHGVRAETIPTDLADPAARDRLAAEIEARGLTVEVLVNNAGFGIYVPFPASDRERELQQLRLQVEAVVDLDARYVPEMVERGRGAVMNIASTAGFQPLPGNNTYAACKAFVLQHTEALHDELRGTGVTATVVAPGPVASEFQETSDPAFADHLPKLVWRDPARVARDAIRAVERGRRSVIPGGPAVKLAFAGNRVIPSRVTSPVTRRLMREELRRGRD
jgi:short-subunit dehydrogenase